MCMLDDGFSFADASVFGARQPIAGSYLPRDLYVLLSRRSYTTREFQVKDMMATTVLWVYIALLILGGVIGFVKAGSRVSLISSVVFAVALALFAAGILPWKFGADVLLVVLLVVFAARYLKVKKFMPAGLMIVLTLAALALRLLAMGLT
jgi:uncharacterized membrane protein (UPF0136 family)